MSWLHGEKTTGAPFGVSPGLCPVRFFLCLYPPVSFPCNNPELLSITVFSEFYESFSQTIEIGGGFGNPPNLQLVSEVRAFL